MKKQVLCVAMSVVMMALVLGAGTAGAGPVEITITTADGDNGADTVVGRHDFSPLGQTHNYGKDWRLTTAAYTQTFSRFYSRKTYLRFDLDDLTAVTGARLEVAVRSQNLGSSTHTLAFYALKDGYSATGKLDENWAEGTGTFTTPTTDQMDWENAPANDTDSRTAPLNVGVDTFLLGTFTFDSNNIGGSTENIAYWVTVLDGTDLVQQINNNRDAGDNAITILMMTDEEVDNAVGYFSRDTALTADVGYGPNTGGGAEGDGYAYGTVAPRLVITTQDLPVAEPATLGLLGLALLGLRKRRN
jgi:hypothetical protein